MASTPDLWTMLGAGLALLGAARWLTRIQAAATSSHGSRTLPAAAEPAPPRIAAAEPAPRRSA